MTPDQWQRVRNLLAEALEQKLEDRPAFLDRACSTDAALRQEVERLLASSDEARSSFLQSSLFRLDSACDGDQWLRQEVESLPLEQGANTEGLLHSPIALAQRDLLQEGASWVGQRIGPYEISELIGEGGMGTVYRAARADQHYKKEVAIKIVKLDWSTPSDLARFRAERQILANLEHPNIARLLDGGATENGFPYVVMELVEGQSIDQYCESHRLSIEERLRLFRTVCMAVHYAHQHLVVHRDLKPGNILVTREGNPKLLDFGIAKILDTGSFPGEAEPTINFMRLLTPQYASPEQVRGEAVTTASDVYSLGVILFLLLTGRYPYRFDRRSADSIVRAVCDTDPLRPSIAARITQKVVSSRDTKQNTSERAPVADRFLGNKLSNRLRGDLDNIALMALRKEPQKRYASVEQFAEDIRRHLASLPVLAHGSSFGYLAGKFASRHRAGISAALIASLALIAGTAISVQQARIARRERARAEQRFIDVRKLANSLIFEIHDAVKRLPGSTAPRKLIVSRALEYLDSLGKESSSDVALQRELATAYLRVGNVQGGNNVEYLGDTAGALQSYRKALQIRKSVYATEPGQLQSAVELSESYRSLAAALVESGQSKEALEKIQLARQLAEQSLPSHPDDVVLLRELASDYEIEAETVGGDFNSADMGDQTRALDTRRKELEVSERLAKLRPDDPAVQSYVAVSVVQMGDQLLLGGQWRESREYYLQAKSVFERLAAQSPSDRAMVDYLQSVYQRLHFLEMQSGNVMQAATMARKAIDLAEKLIKTDPNDVSAKANLGDDYANLAAALCKVRGKSAAFSAIENALALMSEAAKSDPTNKELLGARAATLTTAAEVYRNTHNYSRALSYYQQAEAIRDRMQAEDPADVASRLRLAATYNREASTLLLSGDAAAATRLYVKALAITDAANPARSHNEQGLYTAADSHSGLGDVEIKLARQQSQANHQRSHLKKACESYQASLKMWDAIREPGTMSPDGFDCTPPAVVAARLKKCQTEVSNKSRFLSAAKQ